jgi:hypothetical protein
VTKRLIDDRWALEVCLDGFAIGVDMPLQALNLNAKQDVVREIYSSTLASVGDFERLIDGVPLDFYEFSTWWLSNRSLADALYSIIDKNLYITSGCYTNPLIKSFRQHRIWKFWESVIMLRALEGARHCEFCCLAGHGMLSDLFGGGFSVPEAGIFIVSWPIKRFKPATHMGEYVTIGDALVDSFLEVLRKAEETPRLGRESLERFANLRAAITEADLSHRLGIARTALGGLADVRADPGMVMGRPNLTCIASALVFASIMQQLDQLRQFDVLNKKGNVKLLHRLKTITSNTEAPAFMTWYENQSTRLRGDIVRSGIDWEKQGQTAQLAVVGDDLQPVSAGDDLEKLDRIYSWFLDSTHTRRNAYDYEILLVLRSWCNEYVGDLLAVAQTGLPGKRKGSEVRVADAIAEHVARALSADMGTVVSYRRMDGVAVLIGFYFADPKISEQIREVLETRFYEIADKPAERSRSMSYRVMQTGKPEACFLLDHRTGSAIPANSTMLSSRTVFPN